MSSFNLFGNKKLLTKQNKLARLFFTSTIFFVSSSAMAFLTPEPNSSVNLEKISSGQQLASNPNMGGGYSPQGCPNIAGSYMRPGDNVVIFWEQNGCDIIADMPSQGFDHSIQGRWAGSYFDYIVLRKNIVNGCMTKMYGRLYQENAYRLRTEIYGSDGRCDLPPNFTENSVWDRR